jgi:GT2 family glycosyltransferase
MRVEGGLAAVAIGRNEGRRLERCIESLRGTFDTVVYVDSGSTDGSVDFVRGLGLDVVELDAGIPFSAGRARNAGYERLQQINPEIRYVQFIDGDCEMDAGWPEVAEGTLSADSGLAIVCGRRRERWPEATIYNRLCDLEWDSPVGDVRSCGGDFMVRSAAFNQIDGFDPSFVGGEEPELCIRLRQLGWRIERLATEMTLHDVAMVRFGQWWLRAQRAGHAYVHNAWKHRGLGDRQILRPVVSILFWAALIPFLVIAGISAIGPRGLMLLGIYPLQVSRVLRVQRMRGWSFRDALAYALSVVVAKFAQLNGMLRFLRNEILNRPPTLIEYKSPESS